MRPTETTARQHKQRPPGWPEGFGNWPANPHRDRNWPCRSGDSSTTLSGEAVQLMRLWTSATMATGQTSHVMPRRWQSQVAWSGQARCAVQPRPRPRPRQPGGHTPRIGTRPAQATARRCLARRLSCDALSRMRCPPAESALNAYGFLRGRPPLNRCSNSSGLLARRVKRQVEQQAERQCVGK